MTWTFRLKNQKVSSSQDSYMCVRFWLKYIKQFHSKCGTKEIFMNLFIMFKRVFPYLSIMTLTFNIENQYGAPSC